MIAAASMLAFVGCGGDEMGKRYSVSGVVKYKGQPVSKATITFKPEKVDGRGAAGEVKDGKYTLTTVSANDGAFPGRYVVLIEDITVDMAAVTSQTKELAKKANVAMPTNGMVDPAMVGKALKTAKNSIPAKYSNMDLSGLKAEVKESSNTLDFDLVD